MRNRFLAKTLVASVVLLTGCDAITGPRHPEPSWAKVHLDERVTDAYTGFGFELFRQLRAGDPDANVFASPTSAAMALAMTYNGAVGQTADEMALALGIGHLDRETINTTNRAWLAALRETGDPRAELAIANSIWYRDWFPVRPSFQDRMRDFYHAEILPITTASAINRWVDRETRGRIDEVVEEIADDVVAYLINALYFKADWTYQFDSKNTRNAPFHLPGGSTVQLPMMGQVGSFATRSDADMAMVRLPYGAGRFSMILALPHPDKHLDTIADRLTPDRWRRWMTEFREPSELHLSLPRFEIEWESSLVESLEAMGMEIPFAPGMADFTDMFEGDGAFISEVLQKTYLRVDEEGTEAAAVTVVEMRVVSGPPSLVFDRPFFLAIYDHATDTVLFLGQITDPT